MSVVSSSFKFDGINNRLILYLTSGTELIGNRIIRSHRTCVECVHDDGVDIPVVSPDPFAC
jgi:hypothetical protein